VDHDDLDWDLRNALRKERVRLALFVVVFVVGAGLATAGSASVGALLMLASGLGFVNRILVGMLKTPEID